jgi:hypothetical protein
MSGKVAGLLIDISMRLEEQNRGNDTGHGVRQWRYYAMHRLLTLHAICHLGVWQTAMAWSDAIQKVER